MEILLPFILAVLALLLVPGPDMALVTASGVAYGRRGALYSALGIGTGGLVLAATTAVVLALAAQLDAGLVSLLQVAGASYLLWLAFTILRHPAGDGGSAPVVSDGRLFLRGMLTNLSNPKALVFFLAFLPQFVPADSASPALVALGLGILLCALGTSVNFAIGATGARLSAVAERRIARRSLGQWVLGLVFFGIGLAFLARLISQ